MAEHMLDIPAQVLPYATATALTKAAKRAQYAVIGSMRSSFRRPVAYTLNATRIEIATKDKLFARVAIKDAGTGGARPTSYLLPEVEGGKRSHTGLEGALRARGLLHANEWALPQSGSVMTEAGGVSGRVVRSILSQLGTPGSRYFVGALGKKGTRGLWERGKHIGGRRGKNQTRSVRALYTFTTSAPSYRPLLDFTGAAALAVRDGFAADFYAAAESLTRKFS